MIHETAEVSPKAKMGKNVYIWNHAQVREGADIGDNCILSKGVYVDFDVKIGKNVKIQNYCSIYHGAAVEEGVFIGPHVCVLNDKLPRAITKDGELKKQDDWKVSGVTIKKGASIGGAAVLLPGVTIGKFALIGAGAVVTRDVPDHAMAYGNPARVNGFVCTNGHKLKFASRGKDKVKMKCPACGEEVEIPGNQFVDE